MMALDSSCYYGISHPFDVMRKLYLTFFFLIFKSMQCVKNPWTSFS